MKRLTIVLFLAIACFGIVPKDSAKADLCLACMSTPSAAVAIPAF